MKVIFSIIFSVFTFVFYINLNKECTLAHSRACVGRLQYLPYTPQYSFSQRVFLLYRKAIFCKVKKVPAQYSLYRNFIITYKNKFANSTINGISIKVLSIKIRNNFHINFIQRSYGILAAPIIPIKAVDVGRI